MACYHLVNSLRSIKVYRDGKTVLFGKKFTGNKNGKVYSPLRYEVIKLPCGRCSGCRLEYARQWAMRCEHEASIHDNKRGNCFITLTFKDKFIEFVGDSHTPNLNGVFFQKFMKRLRKRFVSKCPFPVNHPWRKRWLEDNGIRFYHAAEYGEKYGRPHHHALLFNFDFDDLVFLKYSNGIPIYTSKVLESLWSDPKTGECYGHCSVGRVTFESASYVARYCMKKVNGKLAPARYEIVDKDTGEFHGVQTREFCTMSRNPGIARRWYEKYMSDVYPRDEIVMRKGRKMRPPKYYDGLFELDNPEQFASLKLRREENMLLSQADNTPERLAVREACKLDDIKRLKRSLG